MEQNLKEADLTIGVTNYLLNCYNCNEIIEGGELVVMAGRIFPEFRVFCNKCKPIEGRQIQEWIDSSIKILEGLKKF